MHAYVHACKWTHISNGYSYTLLKGGGPGITALLKFHKQKLSLQLIIRVAVKKRVWGFHFSYSVLRIEHSNAGISVYVREYV